jgi:ABC-type multidrug transport system fused ATPase/permease subunit
MERFDHIYFFEGGKVALEGNHERLMNYEKYRLYMRNFAAK